LIYTLLVILSGLFAYGDSLSFTSAAVMGNKNTLLEIKTVYKLSEILWENFWQKVNFVYFIYIFNWYLEKASCPWESLQFIASS